MSFTVLGTIEEQQYMLCHVFKLKVHSFFFCMLVKKVFQELKFMLHLTYLNLLMY